MKISKDAMKVANATAKEEYRPAYRQVLLRDGKLLAADGYMAAMTAVEVKEGDRICQEEVLLPKEIFNLKPSEKNRESVEVTLQPDGDTIEAKVIIDAAQHWKDPSLTFRRERHEYPPLERIIPRFEKKARVCLNIELLRRALSCMPKQGNVYIGLGGEQEAVEFFYNNFADKPIRVIQMPMFVEPERFIWAKDDPDYQQKEEETGATR